MNYKMSSIVIMIGMVGQVFLGAQNSQRSYYDTIKRDFSGWNVVTREMLTGPVYKGYDGATNEVCLVDGSKIILLFKHVGDRVHYAVVAIDKTNRAKAIFQDSWPDGNPTPFLLINRDSRPKDIRTKKGLSIDPKLSFIFDEWAYRWVLAKVDNKWKKVLIQAEES